MRSSTDFESGQWQYELQAIATAVYAFAQDCQGDSLALLALLRQLEEMHRELRDGIFQASLPDNRQALYTLLKDVEAKGGWPYIERMKLQSFLVKFSAEVTGEQGSRGGAGEQESRVAEGEQGSRGGKPISKANPSNIRGVESQNE